MKMKKIFILFSMIILTLSMTACSKGSEGVDFDYDKDTLISNSETIFNYFIGLSKDDLDFYSRSEYEFYVTAVKAISNAKDQAGTFKSLDDSSVEEEGSDVIVTLNTTYSKKAVNIVFVYDQSSMDSYVTTGGLYVPTEITASAVVSKGELLKEAGLNTLMGMGTVFAVLIFISFIISFFKYIPGPNSVKKDKKTKKDVQVVPSSTPVATTTSTSSLMDDAELVAVITAAICASEEGNGTSKDQLVVRSIKRARR